MQTIQLQDLLRRQVRDQRGQPIGRIEEVVGESEGDDVYVSEFHTGGYALLEHLTTITLGEWLPRWINRNTRSYIIRWDQIDITDPSNIRLTCNKSELRTK